MSHLKYSALFALTPARGQPGERTSSRVSSGLAGAVSCPPDNGAVIHQTALRWPFQHRWGNPGALSLKLLKSTKSNVFDGRYKPDPAKTLITQKSLAFPLEGKGSRNFSPVARGLNPETLQTNGPFSLRNSRKQNKIRAGVFKSGLFSIFKEFLTYNRVKAQHFDRNSVYIHNQQSNTGNYV